ncbi:hypothetical protein ACODUM_03360 [Stenotrophomonas maltophilia]
MQLHLIRLGWRNQNTYIKSFNNRLRGKCLSEC